MQNFAFIFARGGSKGLPGKNIKLLANKPLIKYSIDVAIESPSISRVFVSTDDSQIAAVALASGAILIERPEELATDKAPEWFAWRHAIKWVTERYGHFDNFISLPATSPLRSVVDVESAIKKRQNELADICISITEANRSPYFNMVKFDSEGNIALVNPLRLEITRRQDAPKVFDITTVVYVASPSFILNEYGIFSGKVTSVFIPKERAVDIDDIYDFKLAEVILKEEKNGYVRK